MIRHLWKATLLAMIVLVLAGCGPAAPTPSPVPPTATALPTPTPTVVPTGRPTATPVPTPTPTAPPTPQPTLGPEALIAYVESLGTQEDFSGAVLVAREDTAIFAAAYGLADRSADLPNQVDTKFNLGSMNKMFTAIAILQLAEQGRLSLQDKIAVHLPDYANQEVANAVTIHHLLTHSSGLGDIFSDDYIQAPKGQFWAVADYLPLFVDDPLQFEPGAGFSYSNAGFIVLGLIIEGVTGQSYDAYVRENIFQPAGMFDTDSYALDAGVPNLALGYTSRDFEYNDLGTVISNTHMLPIRGMSAGGGYSTVVDLLRFRNALLQHRLLSPESTALLLEGKIDIGDHARYAYGFMDRVFAGQRVVGHTGGAPGICSFLYIFIDQGYTVAVLSNVDGGCVPVLKYLEQVTFP